MKTYKNLYPQIYNFSNLYQALRAARKGKRDRVAVASDARPVPGWAANSGPTEDKPTLPGVVGPLARSSG